ncbi:MAG: GerMN domain-containing protein [Thermodesulfovibrionales bacterium]|nr:GerMN domain-containing protein [Thermodesulfovibrionales bacterium]
MLKLKNLIIVFLTLVLAFLAGWFTTKYYLIDDKSNQPQFSEKKETSQKNLSASGQTKIVKIYIPVDHSIETKEITINADYLIINLAEELIKEFLKELKYDTNKTKLLGVYRDSHNNFYIDLSDDIRRYFLADAKYEYNFYQAFVKTITENIDSVGEVKLLVEGKEIESLGGHFFTSYKIGQ